MDKNNHEYKEMMAKRRANGELWVDTGENINQQIYARELCQRFNHTKPVDTKIRHEILNQLFASCGDHVWIEPPLTLAMGNTVSIGEGTYINSNLTLVDDYQIEIGKGVLIAPNVTITTTNHPIHYKARLHGEMYCKKVVIEDYAWIGSQVVILPGVTIGKGAVVGAGSVVTKDIPPMTVAVGVPCKVIRQITDDDLNEFDPIPELED